MDNQLDLFNTAVTGVLPSCRQDAEHVVVTSRWQEFHKNGRLLVDGQIAVIKSEFENLYDCRYEFKGYFGQPVVRTGVWTKYFDNGQTAWQLDFTDGSYTGGTNKKLFPAYRKDGTKITT